MWPEHKRPGRKPACSCLMYSSRVSASLVWMILLKTLLVSIMVNGEVVDEVAHFTYLGSKVSTSGDGEEILVRISKASQAFASLRGTWRSKKISQKTNIRFFKGNVLSTLLYGAESWKMTKTISHKLEVFQNRCLRRILRIYWPQTLSNYELRRRTGTEPITQQVRRKRWKWLVMCCACHQQHYHELPSDGPLMAVGREAGRKKHGGGQWRKR